MLNDMRLSALKLAVRRGGTIPEILQASEAFRDYLSGMPIVTKSPTNVTTESLRDDLAEYYSKLAFPNPIEPRHRTMDMARFIIGGRKNVIVAPRNSGKTIAGLVTLLWRASSYPHRDVHYVSSSYSIAKTAIETAARMCGCSNIKREAYTLSNGSRIVACSSNADRFRGLTISSIIVDNADSISNTNGEYLMDFVLPATSAGGSVTLIIGDPDKDCWTKKYLDMARTDVDSWRFYNGMGRLYPIP